MANKKCTKDAIDLFRNMIVQNWPLALSAAGKVGWDEDPYFLDRWLQANWEILVERVILDKGFLLPYGYNDDPACRYGHKGEVATHMLVCREKSSDNSDRYAFRAFVAVKDSHAKINAPFDFVAVRSLQSEKLTFMPADDVDFEVELLPVA